MPDGSDDSEGGDRDDSDDCLDRDSVDRDSVDLDSVDLDSVDRDSVDRDSVDLDSVDLDSVDRDDGDGVDGEDRGRGVDGETSERVFRFQFDTSERDPVFDVVTTVAELEDRDVTDVPPLHETVDHVLDDMYSTPPVQSAELHVEFTYADYRIDLHQDGHATFEKLA